MKFWDIVSEFIVFRWLFGSHKHHETESEVTGPAVGSADSVADRNSLDDIVDEIVKRDTGAGIKTQSHDRSYDWSYDRSSLRNNDWDSGYSQSDEDFLDEQDEIDMMDDMF